ncbi:MAG: tetratricopeptide repeat protein [Candidatus Zixiibacteriota bacterium]|nr:MAG: tetratricopeptide repeat protein [candidate division Zixibacteria bacterium]
MRISLFVIVLFLILTCSHCFAVDNKTLWDQAADFYDKGNYPSAISSYLRLIEKEYFSSEIYHNLGNAYFKNGQYGRAIWAYRKALTYDPDLEQARTNLEFARSMNLDRIEVREGGFIADIWDFLTGLWGYNEYLIALAIIWWVLGALAALLIYRGNFASWPYYLLIAGLIVAIFSAAAAARRIKIDRLTAWGVLVENAADIREGPGEDFERIEIGHEGLEFKILGEREDSYLIELKNGLKGWIDKEAVLKI